MKQKHKNIAWFYDFTISSHCIFLKPGSKWKAATLEESVEIIMNGGTFLTIDKNYKAVNERLWVPEHGHKVIIFGSRRTLIEMLDKFWAAYVQDVIIGQRCN